ncbi:uncharacterized protein [Musca autumnalis]|uniref:uncharacterized protein n=1 Tax=Musca autumnalis TaxID=221902 RepID=UPI003CF2C580
MVNEKLKAHLEQMGINCPETPTVQQLRDLLEEIREINSSTPPALRPDGESSKNQASDDRHVQQEFHQPASQPLHTHTHVQQPASIPSQQAETTTTSQTHVATNMHAQTNDEAVDRIEKLKAQLKEMKLQNEEEEKKESVVTFADIEAALPKFTGDDGYAVTKWVAEYEKITNVLNCTEAEKFLYARRMLAGSAGLFVRGAKAESWLALKKELCDEFQKPLGTKEILRRLDNRKWQRGKESLHRYALEMQQLADGAPITEAELVEYIVEGMCDKSAASLVFLHAATVGAFKRLIPRYEKMVAEKAQRLARSNMISPAPAGTRCYNCQGFGHYQSSCKKEQRPKGACFKCGRSGHLKIHCPLRAVGAVQEQEVDWNIKPM